MRIMRRALIAGITAGIALMGYTVVSPGAHEGGQLATAAETTPGYAVEDFSYPDSDAILAERGFLLKRGDGHIMLADCGSQAGLLEVLARDRPDKVCFQVTGDKGYLSLELASVFSIRGNDYTTEVNMTLGEEVKNFDIDKNTWTPVGESTDPEQQEHMLVEIITSR